MRDRPLSPASDLFPGSALLGTHVSLMGVDSASSGGLESDLPHRKEAGPVMGTVSPRPPRALPVSPGPWAACCPSAAQSCPTL